MPLNLEGMVLQGLFDERDSGGWGCYSNVSMENSSHRAVLRHGAVRTLTIVMLESRKSNTATRKSKVERQCTSCGKSNATNVVGQSANRDDYKTVVGGMTAMISILTPG